MDALKDQSAVMTTEEAHSQLGKKAISRAAFYNAINRNEVPHLRLGRRILIPRAAFLAWLASAGRVKTQI
jgi:excisionase family DNA binding protein